MKNTKLQWHPAFGAALRITLQEELEYLEMREEYLLSKKPLQMDIAGGISAEQETAADGYPHYQKAERRPDTEDNRTDIQKTQYH